MSLINSNDTRKINLMTHLPRELSNSVLCFAHINYKVIEGAPDIVTCNTNGYLYELKNKKIIRCLNLNENANSVSCYYVLENENLIIFYLILTTSQRLLIIRRQNEKLRVVKAYDNVKEFEVYDFECQGFPQISIKFIDECEMLVCNFPVVSQMDETCNELTNSIADSLNEELQVLNRHIDDLTQEYKQLKKICSPKMLPTDMEKVAMGSVTFSSFITETIEPELMVVDKWFNIYGGKLVLGLRLCNVGNILLQDIEFLIDYKGIDEYVYRSFDCLDDYSNFLFSQRKTSQTVAPKEEICVVGAFRVPDFILESEFSITCYVTSCDLKECLATECFRLTASDIASKTNVGIEDRFTVEDLMAILTVQNESHVTIRTDGFENNCVESALVEELGFKKIKNLKDKLFYCTSTYLKEVFVALQPHGFHPNFYKMLICARDLSQLYLLINALYDLLPENAVVSCDEDWYFEDLHGN